MAEVYLDNAATTKVCDEASKKVLEVMTSKYGNPSSLHLKGLEAEDEIENARKTIAEKLHCETNEIYFTSGGTEANNLAIFGSVFDRKKYGNRIVTTSFEHPSVLGPINELEKQGFEVIKVNPDKNGEIKKESFINAINDKTVLVSMMMVNNEVGTIVPVEFINKVVAMKRAPALIHVDASQAFGKIPVNIKKIRADLLTITAHKIHGPKGVGALYISKNKRILPMLFGGDQQIKIRPGTEASPLIAGFGESVRVLSDKSYDYEYFLSLKHYLIHKLSLLGGDVAINSSQSAIPHIVNLSVLGIRSEIMLHFLESNGIYVSSGSACSKGKKSYVLKKIGLSDDKIDSAIRVSFSKYNTKEEIDLFFEVIKKGIKELIKK